jgi:hypothetical protein
MRIYEVLFAVVGISLIIYLACFYGRTESKVYACSEVGYPVAVDVPQEVIEMCRKAKNGNKTNTKKENND